MAVATSIADRVPGLPGCDARPAIGDRVTVIPNHICVCVNLQTRVWWREAGERLAEVNVDARGMLS